jgi:cellulose synthase (UDP-forming)
MPRADERFQKDPMLTVALIGLLLLSTIVLTRWVPTHPRWRPFVIVLNLVVTIRYLWWRGTETLNWDGGWGMAVSLIVYAAEMYGFFGVLHNYLIATRSLDRTSAPPDARFCPSVDILIASYNETADILTRTIVGCQAITYPKKKIYLLDDGRRPEIEELCRTLGVNYVSRPDNKGAKAGNLNNAFAHTDGEYVATFDADHVPVSSFLLETIGHFRNLRVAQVQTAHHFFNPDLFQGQLRSQQYISNEQDMFNHILQPGRDVHNSSFYCGSGAVFRRAAIADIGGFPMTTVTEDIHTSMILHSRGWQSVYVNKDLSAGLAPESFDAYLTQRRRWARGTMQVMLLRGGLFLRGLTMVQRINYFATLWYWLYGLPRVVYLTAPLAFLLLGLEPLIVRNTMDLLAYYLPHLFVSVAAFQLVTRGMRRVFWSDIYESCIAVQMAATALMFPFNGWRVHFAVTPKGKDAEQRARKGLWARAWPSLVLSVLMLAGLVKGAVALAYGTPKPDGTMVNEAWTAYNLVLMGFGLLLIRQQPQRRTAPRLPRAHFCKVSWPGNEMEAVTTDLSETGVSLRLSKGAPLPTDLDLTIISREGRNVSLHGRLVRSELQHEQIIAAITFVERTPEQHRTLIELMYSAPDSWNVPHGLPMGSPEHVRRIVRSLIEILSPARAMRRLSPRFPCDLAALVMRADGHQIDARAVDVGYAGVGLIVPREDLLEGGTEVAVTISWNHHERTTFGGTVANARSDGGHSVLGLAFVSLDAAQKRDLLKHLDFGNRRSRQERKAA